MWNELALDIAYDKIFLSQLLDAIVGVTSDADNNLRVEDVDSLFEVVHADRV